MKNKNQGGKRRSYFFVSTALLGAVLSFVAIHPARAQERHQSIFELELNAHPTVATQSLQPERASPQADTQPLVPKAQALTKTVLGFYPYWLGDSYATYDFSEVSTVAYFGIELTRTGGIGDLHDWPHTDLITRAHQAGAKVVPTAILHDDDDLAVLLRTPAHRAKAIQNLLAQVKDAGADGINIDFENLDGADRNNLTTFMRELAAAFRAHMTDPHISVDVMGIDWEDAYDVSELLSIVDYMMIMGYDYHWSSGSEAGPIAPLARNETWGWQSVEWSVEYYLKQSNGQSGKILLGVPYYALDWRVYEGDFPNRVKKFSRSIYYTGIKKIMTENGYERLWDDASKAPYFIYDDHQVWYEDTESLAYKYDLVEQKNLAGIGIWALGYEGDHPEHRALLEERFAGEVVETKNHALRFITAPGIGGSPHVRAFLNDGAGVADPNPDKLFVYQPEFRGGVSVATGDVDGDGSDEFIVAPRKGGGPFVRVFEKDGTEQGIQIWPFLPTHRNGMSIASGDVDGDGKDEIAVVPEQGDAARVKIYRYNDEKTIIGEWNAFGAAEVGGSVAFADVDHDGQDEIVVGAGPKGGPHVRIFEPDGTPKPVSFFAYPETYRGGIRVAAGDIDGDGKDEIVTVPQTERARVKIYRYGPSKEILAEWNAFDETVSGATLAVHDLNQDGKAEVIVGAGTGSVPRVIAFDVANGLKEEANFTAYSPLFRGGVSVAVGDFETAGIAAKTDQ